MSPVWFLESVPLALLADPGEVKLGRVPAANPVVGPEVPLGLEREGDGAVPLKIKKQWGELENQSLPLDGVSQLHKTPPNNRF